MSKFFAMLPDEASADQVVSALAKLNVDGLDWRLVEEDDSERIMPAPAWPLGGADSATRGPIGAAIHTDFPEEEVMENRGADGEEAEYYGRSVDQGGTAIVIEVPSDYDSQVHHILRNADAQQISSE
jgi:hypothetical protein